MRDPVNGEEENSRGIAERNYDAIKGLGVEWVRRVAAMPGGTPVEVDKAGRYYPPLMVAATEAKLVKVCVAEVRVTHHLR